MNLPRNNNLQYLRQILTIPHIAAICFLLLSLLSAGQYGFYGDELYYLACSKRLDFGYVDHPPLVALLTLVGTWLFGETLIGLRLLSGLAGAITVLLAAKLAGTIGGGAFSRSLAALSICFAPAFPALSSFFSMNPVDIMLATLFIYLLVKTIHAPSPLKWITLGVLFGIGLLNKYTFLTLGFSLFIALIITKRWEVLGSPWVYIGGFIGFLMFLPHVIWQIYHGFPTLEFMRNVIEYKNLSLSPFEFFSQLIIGLNPFTLPLWLSGLLYLLIGKEMKDFRFLGWTAVIFVLVYLFQNSKFYYVLPVFPLLLSSGSVAVEKFAKLRQISRLKWVIGIAIIVSGALLTPLAVPILPVKQFVSYAKTLGLWDAIRMEKGEKDSLPLHFVHRFGWKELVDAVGSEYEKLPQNEKDKCAILASWYGIAGAIDHFGSARGLPGSICPHNSYWMWGMRNYTGEVVLAVGYDERFLEEFFDSVKRVAYLENPYANDAKIVLCNKPKAPLVNLWSRFKMFL